MLAQLPSSFPAVTSLVPNTPAGASAGAELVTTDGRSLALVGARLVGEAQGGLARLVLEQTFENTFDDNLRVTYRMPLPADGAVSGYEFVIGDRVIKGTIDKKAQARERFERAIASGHTAALLEQERNDIFTQQIGNIPARATVVARITVDQRLVWLPEGEWELRFPTVIGPRYIGSADTAADVRATHIKVADQPLRAAIQIAIAVRDVIAGGGTASSPSHGVKLAGGPQSNVYELDTGAARGARLDRDIVLRWRVATPAPGLSLATARPAAGGKLGDAFGLLTIVPPARDSKPSAVPRDLIVLLDTSGSMSGFPLDKAKQVVSMLIDSLDERDRFELIEFNYQPTRYLAEPTIATAKAKQAAIQWVRSRVADGGTEIRAAVIEAMDTLRVGAQRQVIVVTDGYVGGEQQIIEAMNRRLPKSCRVHVLGVGSAVNRSLASSLARAGRGVEVIIGVDEDAERGAKRLLDRTRMPVLTNVEVSGSALLRHAPALMPDCFEGSPLVAALALRADGGELVVRGQLGNGTWEQTVRVPALAAGSGNQAIVALYGRERVADVEANALFSSVNGEIEELGLTFQIATRMTSWIAIDETRKVTGPSRDQLVPQELPYGTSASAFGLRAMAPMSPVARGRGGRTMAGVVDESELKLGAVAASVDFDSLRDEMGGEFAEEASTGNLFSTEQSADAFAADDDGAYDDDDAPAEAPRGAPLARRPAPMAPAPMAPGSTPPQRAAAAPPASRSRAASFERKQDAAPPEPAAAPRAPESAAAPAAEELESASPVAEPEPKPTADKREAESARAEPVPAKRKAMAGGMPQPLELPKQASQQQASLQHASQPPSRQQSPLNQRSRWPLALALVLMLALIGLLLWWLLG